jgi:hypothetical protein
MSFSFKGLKRKCLDVLPQKIAGDENGLLKV